MLDVAGAFHSPAMAAAVEPFRAALERVELREPAVPVISGATARRSRDVRAELAAAILSPVRWRETMLALGALGADAFLDFGPGEVLARLVAPQPARRARARARGAARTRAAGDRCRATSRLRSARSPPTLRRARRAAGTRERGHRRAGHGAARAPGPERRDRRARSA